MNDILKQGTKVTANGYPGTIVRHYDGNMYEIKLASGLICTDDWALASESTTEESGKR